MPHWKLSKHSGIQWLHLHQHCHVSLFAESGDPKVLKHKRKASGAETRGNTGQLLVLKWGICWTAPGAEIKQRLQFISDSLYPCKQTPQKQGSLVASRQRGAYNGSCLGNASLITLIGLISELAAGKCQSGQQKMEKLINGKGECLKCRCWDRREGCCSSWALLEWGRCETQPCGNYAYESRLPLEEMHMYLADIPEPMSALSVFTSKANHHCDYECM